VLWYYGVFDPSKWAGEQKYCPSKYELLDASLTLTGGGAGTLQIVLGNKIGDPVTLDTINVTIAGAGIGSSSPGSTLPAGEQTSALSVTLSGLGGYSEGSIVNMKMKVSYTNDKTTITNSEICTLALQAG